MDGGETYRERIVLILGTHDDSKEAMDGVFRDLIYSDRERGYGLLLLDSDVNGKANDITSFCRARGMGIEKSDFNNDFIEGIEGDRIVIVRPNKTGDNALRLKRKLEDRLDGYVVVIANSSGNLMD